jgi:chaperonin GroEL
VRPCTLSFAPENQAQLQYGIALLEQTLGSTFGPAGRSVACERIGRPGQPPELLSDGSTIARRMTNLPERFSNMGFMLARQAAWRMRTEAADGATTAVLLLAAAHRELLKFQSAGFNRIALKHGVERFLDEALAEIDRMAVQLDPDELAIYTATMAGDPAVAHCVTEALEVLGPEATIVTRASTGQELKLEFVEGSLWESTAVMAPLLAGDPRARIQLTRSRILLWEGGIENVHAFAKVIEQVIQRDRRPIVAIARSYSTEVLAFIRCNTGPELQIHPVTAPHEGRQQEWAFGDIATLTGCRRFNPDAGDALDRLAIDDIGTAPRVTIGARFLNLFASSQCDSEIGQRVAAVRRQMAQTEDDKEWAHHQLRLGRLQGGMGVIWVGAPAESARDNLLSAVKRCLNALRNAQSGGVVPGGGKALIEIARSIACRHARHDEPGIAAAARTCEAQARWLAANAGVDPSWAVAKSQEVPAGWGLDAQCGQWVDLRAAGIVDSAETLKHALRIGLTTAVLAGDCGVLLHRPVSLTQAEIRL